jgi:hypothetical protein
MERYRVLRPWADFVAKVENAERRIFRQKTKRLVTADSSSLSRVAETPTDVVEDKLKGYDITSTGLEPRYPKDYGRPTVLFVVRCTGTLVRGEFER